MCYNNKALSGHILDTFSLTAFSKCIQSSTVFLLVLIQQHYFMSKVVLLANGLKWILLKSQLSAMAALFRQLHFPDLCIIPVKQVPSWSINCTQNKQAVQSPVVALLLHTSFGESRISFQFACCFQIALQMSLFLLCASNIHLANLSLRFMNCCTKNCLPLVFNNSLLFRMLRITRWAPLPRWCMVFPSWHSFQ